ncbi:hypothetical protein AAMO2058_000980300 [Amorphochlora amoebiformis]|uniref:VHS domain-containing protein n=1 Tax=Amorphochlora amoebiformis TaxID=1561963 RepID=A0A7S0CQ41_9EUKA|mmetsp:Transcript_11231/g.17754  ORF Transcript_11231/g.17754 Transcript_11231/m.17754 type:complete len:428 (+) Transcript_11231:69-1352(+)
MSKVSKEELLEFKGQIKNAILLKIKSNSKIPEFDVARSIKICDKLNEKPILGARAEKTLRKICLGKEAPAAINALRLADMVMKNCPNFRPYLNTKVFSQGVLKSLPKHIRDPQGVSFQSMQDDASEAEIERINKSLLLIQSWSKVLHLWKATHDSLVRKNCQFPEPLKDEETPLAYDDLKVPSSAMPSKPSPKKQATPKFRDSDCKKAATAIEVLNDMLRAQPEDPGKDPIIQELKQQVTTCQTTIHSRLGRETNQLVMDELLKANDLCNKILKLYSDVLSGKPIPEEKKTKIVKQEDTKKKTEKKTKKKKSEKKGKQAKAEKSADLDKIFQDSEGETTKEKPATKTTVPIDFLASAFADESSQGEAKGKDALSASEPAPARQGTFDLLEGVFGKTDDNTTAPPVSARQTSAFEDDAFMALAKKRAE